MEIDPMETCPYDPVHRVLRSRMQRHLYKCSKNHPNSTKIKCHFNPLHIIEKIEYEHHLAECPDRGIIENDAHVLEEVRELGTVPLHMVLDFPSEENWDDEPVKAQYNPLAYAENKPIYRSLICATKSEKKKFKLSERSRYTKLENNVALDVISLPVEEELPLEKPLRLPRKTPKSLMKKEESLEENFGKLSIDEAKDNKKIDQKKTRGSTLNIKVRESPSTSEGKTYTREDLKKSIREKLLKSFRENRHCSTLTLDSACIRSILDKQDMQSTSANTDSDRESQDSFKISRKVVLKPESENITKQSEAGANSSFSLPGPSIVLPSTSTNRSNTGVIRPSTGRGYMLQQTLNKPDLSSIVVEKFKDMVFDDSAPLEYNPSGVPVANFYYTGHDEDEFMLNVATNKKDMKRELVELLEEEDVDDDVGVGDGDGDGDDDDDDNDKEE